MSKTYLVFKLSDSMFDGTEIIKREVLTDEKARLVIKQGVISLLNGKHENVRKVLQERLLVKIERDQSHEKINLSVDDSILVISFRGLSSMPPARGYKLNEVMRATPVFSYYTRLK